ncbi:MAG: hypothetical protein U0271_35960 [Polyangiaceae bacterium]
MGDVTADLKTRYSVFVPKPLARINLGDWQRREGTVQSPKFGYAGVSIQTEKDMFVDVWKATYVQARGGFTVQTTDWFNCAQKALFLATADSATLGADGVMTIAAGAGQAPTWTLDHGDAMEVYPYNSLQLHYRVEEVQNSLFEFFRGRREKDYPADSTTFGQQLLEGLYRKDPSFNSAKKTGLLAAVNPFSDKGSNPRGQSGAKESEAESKLHGGFEPIAEASWQALYGNKQFKLGAKDSTAEGKRPAPVDIFGSLDDIRGNPSQVGYTFEDVVGDGADGEKTEKQLRYGFSSYFSRFDPYALINPDHPDLNNPKRPLYTAVMRALARVHNGSVRLKRTVDVMYKIGSLLKDNAISKLVITGWGAVDASFQAIKAARGQYEVWEAVHLGSRGNLRDQFIDERESGVDKRGAARDKLLYDWTPKTTTKAAVRSKAPEKDFASGETKGFGLDALLVPVPNSSPPKVRLSVLHIKSNAAEFDLPTIEVDAATAAKIAGSAASGDAWVAQGADRTVSVKFDKEDWITVNIGNPTIMSASDAASQDQALAALSPPVAAHFVSDRNALLEAVRTAITNAVGARATVSSGALTFTSATVGVLSKVQLEANPPDTMRLLGLSKASATGTNPGAELTADALLAAWTAAAGSSPPWSGKVDITVEDGQLVFTSKVEGDGSFVEVSGSMASSFDFKGDFRGETDRDEVRELDVHRRRMDSFQKLDEELLKFPDDVAALVRPAVLLYKNAVGVVSKTVAAVKAIVKVFGLKLPQTKGAVGIVASKGISLGTPDRIVGAGGQGVVFIADGGTGLPDQAKYVVLEEIINRITGADLLAPFFAKPYARKDPKPTLGFRAYSDTSTDLIARNAANVLALGRVKDKSGNIVGAGIARVAASYAVEIAAQEKVVIGAREGNPAQAGTGLGRVEVLGNTIALGYSEIDTKEGTFGPADRGPNKGWPGEWHEPKGKNTHAKTESVLVHSTDQACIVVGKYMVQLRNTKNSPAIEAHAKAHVDRCKRELDALQKTLVDKQKEKAEEEEWEESADQVVVQRLTGEITDLTNVRIPAKTAEHVAAQQLLQNVQAGLEPTSDEGIVISMRDPDGIANNSLANHAWKSKPAIVLSDKGITITTKTSEADDASGARITLDADGISVAWNKKAGILVKNDSSIVISDGTNKATFGANKWDFAVGQVAFSNAQKITLG